MLPDNDHVISESSDITDRIDANTRRMIATAVLVKPAKGSPEIAPGRLLLFDPTGKKVVEVASNARDVHLASLSGGELSILYERDRRLVLAAFDPGSLAKRSEQEIDVPQVK